MNSRIQISQSTAKKILFELLADGELLKDADVKAMLKGMVRQEEQDTDETMGSHVHIDAEGRIFLPGFSKQEVKMPYLPKTVYLFFLFFDESGVEFKKLSAYVDILYRIYLIVSEEKNIEAGKIRKTLENLVEPVNNRIYEICSIIRRSLYSIIPEEQLPYYVITGKWGGRHRIKLNRKWIRLENEKLKSLFELNQLGIEK